jgi:ribonuclease P protein component
VVCWAPNESGSARFGLTVSRKVGNAVVRNRGKRWLREALRRSAPHPDLDVVIIALPSSAAAGFGALSVDVARGLQRLRRADGPIPR